MQLKKPMSLMLDLETLGCQHDAAIIQIGACFFDDITGEISSTFLENVLLKSSLDCGLTVDASTIEWWMKQEKLAINSVLSLPRSYLVDVLVRYKLFAEPATKVWCHSTFDFIILMNAYKKCRLDEPHKYYICRDLRTLGDLANTTKQKFKREGIHHNALDDCKFQVQYCVEALRDLRLHSS